MRIVSSTWPTTAPDPCTSLAQGLLDCPREVSSGLILTCCAGRPLLSTSFGTGSLKDIGNCGLAARSSTSPSACVAKPGVVRAHRHSVGTSFDSVRLAKSVHLLKYTSERPALNCSLNMIMLMIHCWHMPSWSSIQVTSWGS